MCFDVKELNLKVVMMEVEMRIGVEMRLGKLVGIHGGKVVGWGEHFGDGGAVEVVWIRGGCNCVEVLGPCYQLFLKVYGVFGDNGEEERYYR